MELKKPHVRDRQHNLKAIVAYIHSLPTYVAKIAELHDILIKLGQLDRDPERGSTDILNDFLYLNNLFEEES